MYVANIVDFLVAQVSTDSAPLGASDQRGMKFALLLTYMSVGWIVVTVFDALVEPGLSFSLFLGSAIQLLAYLSLVLKVLGSKSVEGLSSQSLMLTFITLSSRLLCTCIYQGYLPADSTGDLVYQLLDAATLSVVLFLLYSVHKTFVHTYQDEHDRMKIVHMVTASAVLSFFIHGNLNRSPAFDMLWAFSLNVEVVQMLPQVYMLAKVGGLVDKTTAHFVANVFLAAVCRAVFWAWAIEGCEELSSEDGYTWNMPIAGYHIIVAHIVQILILLDFMYYYVKWWRSGGTSVTLPQLNSETI